MRTTRIATKICRAKAQLELNAPAAVEDSKKMLL